MDEQEGDEETDHQTNEDAGDAQTWTGNGELRDAEQRHPWSWWMVVLPTVLGLRDIMEISAPIRPNSRGWKTSQDRPTIAATGAWRDRHTPLYLENASLVWDWVGLRGGGLRCLPLVVWTQKWRLPNGKTQLEHAPKSNLPIGYSEILSSSNFVFQYGHSSR